MLLTSDHALHSLKQKCGVLLNFSINVHCLQTSFDLVLHKDNNLIEKS